MSTAGKHYSTMSIGKYDDLKEKGRIVVGETLGLTGCEVSLNSLPAGKISSFLHTHKLNEEVYIILSGNGTFKVDDDEIPIQEGSLVRVAPAGKRAINAGDAGLVFVCIQAQENSLTQASREDGVIIS